MQAWNESMSEVRVSVAWTLGHIINYFKFLDLKKKKNLKISFSAVGKMYVAFIALLVFAAMDPPHQTTLMFLPQKFRTIL